MTPTRSLVAVLVGLGLGACSKAPAQAPTTDPVAATPQTEAQPKVVRNVDAQPGDTTTCPYSGRSFVVKAEDPRVEYEGQTYWVCSEDAAKAVRADPAKYLADFDG